VCYVGFKRQALSPNQPSLEALILAWLNSGSPNQRSGFELSSNFFFLCKVNCLNESF